MLLQKTYYLAKNIFRDFSICTKGKVMLGQIHNQYFLSQVPKNKHVKSDDSNIAFGINLKPYYFNDIYQKTMTDSKIRANGSSFDKFIIDIITKHCKIPEKSHIFDIGSGDGKNTIELARSGYNVTAMDLADKAIEANKKLAEEKFISLKKVNFLVGSILNKTEINNEYDVAFMVHLTQYFNNYELTKVFEKANSFVKKDGLFAFDARIVPKNEEHIHNQFLEEQREGSESFIKTDIINMAKEKGFKLKKYSCFQEQGENRPEYEDWMKDSLRWFVFKKQ